MERNYSIDFFKFFAILGVVFIHTNLFSNEIGFILHTFSRFAVPFFFMSSGYLFNQTIAKQNTLMGQLKKYLSRIIKIYFCWVLFYFIYDILSRQVIGTLKNDYVSLLKNQTLINVLYYGDSTSGFQLWFLTALIWSILIISIFAFYNKIGILLLVSIILNTIALLGESYTMFFELPLRTRDTMCFGLMYTTLGYFLGLKSDQIKKIKIKPLTLSFLFLFFSFTQMIERYILITQFAQPKGSYFLSTAFISLSLFLFVLKYSQLGKGSIINKIGSNSLGIFVIHVFFIGIINLSVNFLNLSYINNSVVWQSVYPLIVFVLSYVSYEWIQKVKSYFKQINFVKMITTARNRNFN
ncbi:acyltransferase [Bacillus sp. Y1]|nr:acyltransferase [Bacillus sp. Y1]AYA77598.1 acyltransferase [Bacillus sp. Y1]